MAFFNGISKVYTSKLPFLFFLLLGSKRTRRTRIPISPTPRRGSRRVSAHITHLSSMCGGRLRAAFSFAAITPTPRILTTARLGTPASAATPRRSLNSRSTPGSIGDRPPPTCATWPRSTAATNCPSARIAASSATHPGP